MSHGPELRSLEDTRDGGNVLSRVQLVVESFKHVGHLSSDVAEAVSLSVGVVSLPIAHSVASGLTVATKRDATRWTEILEELSVGSSDGRAERHVIDESVDLGDVNFDSVAKVDLTLGPAQMVSTMELVLGNDNVEELVV